MTAKVFEIPIGAKQTACKSCGEAIYFVTSNELGKRPIPVNPDGQSHFGTCPQRDTWRGKSRESLERQGSLFDAATIGKGKR